MGRAASGLRKIAEKPELLHNCCRKSGLFYKLLYVSFLFLSDFSGNQKMTQIAIHMYLLRHRNSIHALTSSETAIFLYSFHGYNCNIFIEFPLLYLFLVNFLLRIHVNSLAASSAWRNSGYSFSFCVIFAVPTSFSPLQISEVSLLRKVPTSSVRQLVQKMHKLEPATIFFSDPRFRLAAGNHAFFQIFSMQSVHP